MFRRDWTNGDPGAPGHLNDTDLEDIGTELAFATVRVATTIGESYTYTISSGSVTQISGPFVDAVTVAVNDRILIKDAPAATGAGTVTSFSGNGGTSAANGVYIVTSIAGGNIAVSRDTDASGSVNPVGFSVRVRAGSTYAGFGFVVSSPTTGAFTWGTTAIGFTANGLPARINQARNRQSLMAIGDSAVIGISPYDPVNNVDAHIGGGGGHSPGDFLWIGNLLANSPMDILGAVSTAGLTAQQIKDQLLPTLLGARPAPTYCVAWTLCFNDLRASGTMSNSVFRTCETILYAMMEAGIIPVLCSALPGSNASNPDLSQSEIHRYNAWTSSFAQRNGIPYLDFYSDLVEKNSGSGQYGTYKSGYAQSDNLHPTGLGIYVMAKVVRDWINQVSNTVRQSMSNPYTEVVGDGTSTTIPVVHGLDADNVWLVMKDATTNERVETDWTQTDSNTVTLTFGAAPAAGSLVVSMGTTTPATYDTRFTPAQWQSGTGAIITGQIANPLLIRTGGAANTPDGWSVGAGITATALAAPRGVIYAGNEWTLTWASNTNGYVQSPSLACVPGDEWDLTMRIGAKMLSDATQNFFIYMYDNNSVGRAIWGSGTLTNGMVMQNIPQGTLLHARGKFPASPSMTSCYFLIGIISSATTAKIQIGQFTFRNLTAMSI